MNVDQLAREWKSLSSRGLSAYDALDELSVGAPAHLLAYAVVASEHGNPSEETRGALARHLIEAKHLADAWPLVMLLLSPPFPTEVTSQLNLLSLIHHTKPTNPRVARVLSRIAGQFLLSALRRTECPLVAEEALNVLGGLDADQLAGTTSNERTHILAAAQDVLRLMDDPSLVIDLTARVFETMHALPAEEPIRPADAELVCALVDTTLLELRTSADKRRADLEWTQEDLRAVTWSNVTAPAVVGVQRLRISRTNTTNEPLDAWDVVDRWIEVFVDFSGRFWESFSNAEGRDSQLVVPRFLPVAARHASIGITFAITSSASEQNAMAGGIEAFVRAFEDPQRAGEHFAELLEELRRRNLSVTIDQRRIGETPLHVDIGKPEIIRVVATWTGGRPMPRLDTGDVPQANELDRVFRVADCLAEGLELSKENLDIGTPRQVAYYKQAARILGLTNASGSLTMPGLMVHRVTEPDDRLRRGAVLFEACPVGQAWVVWSGGQTLLGVTPGSAKQFLSERSDLSGDTIGRRANCLEQWLKEFQRALKRA